MTLTHIGAASPAVSKEAQGLIFDIDTGTKVQACLEGMLSENIEKSRAFPSTIYYMIYWYHRFEKQPEVQQRYLEEITKYLIEYGVDDARKEAHDLVENSDFREKAKEFSEKVLPRRKTVDLFITKGQKIVNEEGNLEFLTYQRREFPVGNSLPGGIILESDGTNEYGFPGNIFAALRVGGEKVLGLKDDELKYSETEEYYIVSNMEESLGLKIEKKHVVGYRFEENLSNVIYPSDPRHIVNTTGFKMEFFGDIPMENDLQFTRGVDIKNMSSDELVFEHHRKLLWGLYAKTPEVLENEQKHSDFIRNVIKNPEETYNSLHERFKENDYAKNTSMPEFLPIVKHVEEELFSERVNRLCENNTALIAMRDTLFQNLQHLHLGNKTVCPYLATVVGLMSAMEFFDIVVREEIGFYNKGDANDPVIHDPGERSHAKYHTYKYNYRFDDYFYNPKFNREIMIPTFIHVGATDLMNIRGVPLRIVGLSSNLLYVDEFEQTPLEFTAHDLNHCRRYALEDQRIAEEMGMSLDELYEKSSKDVRDYMKNIIINKSDTEEEKEKKRLKKIILFEIVHEDARVFLKQTIFDILLKLEGHDVPFEWKSYNPEMKKSTVVDIQEAYIHTLSYVRYKLQKGFYDTFEDQKSYIVGKESRYSRKIGEVAYEMLEELGCEIPDGVPKDAKGNVDLDWIMQRIWSYGPPEIHQEEFDDPDREKYDTNFSAATERLYDV